ncbi:hypothetical protein G3N55_06205 [Dissulfurirhabdus thermomarina]|uniref:Periplasmic chaperone PpiD n=1 Tax=Dissulfurirhabdus thermomarina TaxID=1765737 RepID=A0A6N9TRP9_DISTH|nr:SurA N-terminal domain-containing protein [Dissulfurirhabdus thermomarina]NDY42434.1 hypothetical protein [Dissulfurirhabdus thermomarina]NMX24085.1 hypothetical protein [Dissulfurirhabdus thermomarina]
MLEFIRRNVGSWIVKVILGLIILVFIPWGVGSLRSRRAETLAEVNGEPILHKDFDLALERTRDRYRQIFGGTLPEHFEEQVHLKEQVLERLVTERVMRQAAEAVGVRVRDPEVQQAILSVPAFRSGGVFDQRLYRMALQNARMTPEDYEAEVRQQLLAEKLGALFATGITVGGDEARAYYGFQNEEIDVAYVRLAPADCRDEVRVDEAELEAWYRDHRERYRTEPRVRVRYLLFSRKSVGKVTVPDDEVRAYYEEHKKEFEVPERRRVRHILLTVPPGAGEAVEKEVRARAEALRRRIEKGADFARLARRHSEDPATAKKGGDLGFITRGTMVPAFDKAAFELEAGKVSAPVRTRFGWHLVKVEKIEPGRVKPFKEVAREIRRKLARRKAASALAARANAAYDEIFELGGLAAYAKRHGLSLETTGFFTRSAPAPVLGDDPDVLRNVFALGKGEMSSLLRVPDGVLILEVLDKEPPRVPPLQEVRAKALEDYTDEAAEGVCREKAARLLAEARKAGLSAAARKEGLEVRESGFFRRSDREAGGRLPAEVVAAALSRSEADPLPDEPVAAGGASYVLAFKARRAADPSGFEAARKDIEARLLEEKRRAVFQGWLEAARKQAEVRVRGTL